MGMGYLANNKERDAIWQSNNWNDNRMITGAIWEYQEKRLEFKMIFCCCCCIVVLRPR